MGLVFCREFDSATFSLRGLFQGLYFSAFPANTDPFIVYASMYSGGVEGTLQLTCTRLETERDIFTHSERRSFANGAVIQLLMPVSRLRLPAPGRYAFRLQFDGTELTYRYLEVIREVKT